MNRNRQWINTRVVLDMTSGRVLSKQGFFYRGPLALAEGKTPEEQLKELQAALDAATKDKDTTIAELAKLRKQLADVQKGALSDDDKQLFDKLKADAKKAEEDKLKEAGRFDELRQQLVDKHTAEIKARDDANATLTRALRETLVSGEFARASALFGKDGKTILTPEIAESFLGKYVHVEDVQGSDKKAIVVKNADGQIILNAKTGKPAAFQDALLEIIEGRPDKDAILRGSGKTGSGNSGGGQGGKQPDLANPKTSSDFADPKVREAVHQKHNSAGGIQQGTVWNK